jgi:hypothetical protein
MQTNVTLQPGDSVVATAAPAPVGNQLIVTTALPAGTYSVGTGTLMGPVAVGTYLIGSPIPPPQPPPAPTGLTATPGNAQVTLAWQPSAGATSYKVYRSTVLGQETFFIGGVTGTTWIDSPVANGTTYYYQVTAVNANGESARSSEVSATPSAGGGPLTLPLVQPGDPIFTYLGYFLGPTDGSFQYGGGGLSVGGNSPGVRGHLYANGLQQGNNCLGKMTIPAPTGPNGTYLGTETAQTLVPGTTPVPLGNMGGSGGNQTSLTGSLEYGGKLYVTGAIDYDASASQNVFMAVGNPSVSGFGALCSATFDGGIGSHDRMLSNGMNVLPAIWQPILGGPAYVFGGIGGGAGLSIVSRMCCGPGFFTFDPAKVVPGNPVNVKEWISFPYNTEGTNDTQHVSKLYGYSPASQPNWGGNPGDNYVTVYDGPHGCGFIVPGSRTLLYLHCHMYGPAGPEHSDPCNLSASGTNCTPVPPDTKTYKRIQLEAFDIKALVDNKNAGGPPDALRPYAWWEFPNWKQYWGTPPSEACSIAMDYTFQMQAWATFDYANGLLYVSMGWGGINGQVWVFKVQKS